LSDAMRHSDTAALALFCKDHSTLHRACVRKTKKWSHIDSMQHKGTWERPTVERQHTTHMTASMDLRTRTAHACSGVALMNPCQSTMLRLHTVEMNPWVLCNARVPRLSMNPGLLFIPTLQSCTNETSKSSNHNKDARISL